MSDYRFYPVDYIKHWDISGIYLDYLTFSIKFQAIIHSTLFSDQCVYVRNIGDFDNLFCTEKQVLPITKCHLSPFPYFTDKKRVFFEFDNRIGSSFLIETLGKVDKLFLGCWLGISCHYDFHRDNCRYTIQDINPHKDCCNSEYEPLFRAKKADMANSIRYWQQYYDHANKRYAI